MLNNEEKSILKNFINKKFPTIFYDDGNQSIVLLDAEIAGHSSTLLHGLRIKKIPTSWISEEEENIIKKLLYHEEVANYYNLLKKTIEIIDKKTKK